ncbi:MAG TPA: serine hydrolase [Azospirillaceae bacterium]|nr:serine hydrolase [Azospirillaceae bacterium]
MTSLAAAVDAAFKPAAEAVAAGRIPCAVFGAVTPGGQAVVRWAGQAQLVPDAVAADRGTVFDLASLTKVISTTTGIMKLVEAGRLDLDDPLSRHLPDFFQYRPDAAVRRLTIRQCLAHQTGLPAVEPVYTWGEGAERLKALVLQRDWPIGEPAYSDINFILLGLILERAHGRPLADLAHLDGFGFTARPDPARCAATERCMWRGRVIRGEVHDENAFALGGLAGHAGLFGTIDAVLDFASAMMDGRILSRASLDEMRRPQGQLGAGMRGLGWDRRHPGWPGGALCSPDTIGHTGFTGTGLWMDFGHGAAWALLTNRVHPSRHVETGIMDLRRATGNTFVAALTGAGV